MNECLVTIGVCRYNDLLKKEGAFEILMNACENAKAKGYLNSEVEAVVDAICGKGGANESV